LKKDLAADQTCVRQSPHRCTILRAGRYMLPLVGMGACAPEATLCARSLKPPIFVEVRDARTGVPAAQGAGGWIQAGGFTSPLAPAAPEEQLILASSGGPGIYNVVVQKSGYSTWIRSSVFVPGGRCGVDKSIQLSANLQPST